MATTTNTFDFDGTPINIIGWGLASPDGGPAIFDTEDEAREYAVLFPGLVAPIIETVLVVDPAAM